MASEGSATPSEPAIDVFRARRTVIERDIDALDHVNNVVWLRFVMELAGAHYHSPAELGDEILEETWVSRMRGASSVRHARLSSLRDGALHLAAVTRWAFVDPGNGRPRRLPPEVLERFVPISEPPALEPPR
jgi:acyl-CoA thioester hydrolase